MNRIINGVNLMGEIVPGYTDVRSDLTFDSDASKYQVNIGMEYSFWKDYINAVVELNRCRYFFRWTGVQGASEMRTVIIKVFCPFFMFNKSGFRERFPYICPYKN